MSEAEQFFFSEACAHARTMKISEAALFLRGLLECTGGGELAERIRAIHISLCESDRQLALFQTGQLKLPLKENGGNP